MVSGILLFFFCHGSFALSGIRLNATPNLRSRLQKMHKRIRKINDAQKRKKIFYLSVFPGEYEETKIEFDEPFESPPQSEEEFRATVERLEQKLEASRRQADEARRQAAELVLSNAALRISEGALATEVREGRRCIDNLRVENFRLRAAAATVAAAAAAAGDN